MIDPNVPMAHSQVNEFLPSARAVPNSRNAMADSEVDDFDVGRFHAIRKEQKEQMMELQKSYQDRKDFIKKTIQAEQESLFNAFQQGMQSLYGSLVQQVATTIERQVTLRLDEEKLEEQHAAGKRDIERRYHHEASKVLSTPATRNSTQVPRASSSGSHTNSFLGSNCEHQQPTPTASVMQTPPVQHQTVTRPASNEGLPRDFVLQEPPRREYLAPYPTPQEIVPTQRIPAPSEPRPIQPQPLKTQPMPIRQTYEETMNSQPQQASHQQNQYQEPSNVTPSRSDLKRKAYDGPGSHIPAGTVIKINNQSKRPRTSEKHIEAFQDPYQAHLKPSPRTPRSAQPIRESPIDRTIPFEEIYQDGKAQYKHKIFEHKAGSGNWYIVRCDEHQVHFGYGNPLHGAAKHVHSPQHGNLEKKHDLALQICGHRITGCNAELATLNNSVFERAVKEEGYVPFNMNLLTKEGRRRLHDGAEIHVKAEGHAKKKPPKLNINSDEANNIRDCDFYQGLWSPPGANKKWYALIVLPILPDGSLEDVGLPQETLGQTDLMDKVPQCYRVDRNSLQIKEWKPSYKTGGDKVDRREYPVMYFDGVQKVSLGWLPAYKLKPLDLDNPPDDVDKRGLAAARAWFAHRMMHRKDWDDYKKFGPGQPPLEGVTNRDDPVSSLRSARMDVQSPIRDKSNKPEGFSATSSEEGSDEEGPTRMNIGPTTEPADSHDADDLSSELSDVEMEDDLKGNELEDQILAGRAPGPVKNVEEAKTGDETADSHKSDVQSQNSPEVRQPARALESQNEDRRPGLVSTGSEHEQLRKDAQARAAAAVMEAVSRSRASSEAPEAASGYQAQPIRPSDMGGARSGCPLRPNGVEHHRSRSDNNFVINGGTGLMTGGHQLDERRKPSDLHSILNQEHTSAASGPKESPNDPYKRAEAIAAQMEGLKSRSASAPIHEGKGSPSPFPPPPPPPPPLAPGPTRETLSQGHHHSPSLSHILSPPVQSPTMMPPRSSSSTPVQAEMERSSPKIPSVAQLDKWQAVRTSYQTAQTPTKASFVNAAPIVPSSEPVSKVSQSLMTGSLATPTTQLGTPISDKQESFDVSQFRDSARGVRWSRDGPTTGFLRLTTDAMRGWAETVKGSPLTATIEPNKIGRIEVDALDGETEKERVNLNHRDGNQQTLVFETNSANQRLVKAAVQRRRFVTWFKKINSSVEYRNGSESRRGSTVADDRSSVTVE